ncbi:MAG: hypothetical protein R2710_22810, partial [Acidimicrobiales bacterium]
YGVVRFTPAGARDTTYGPVRIEAFGSRPLMVVERDGSVTIATYTSESHSELRYHRIDADGRLSTIRTIGRPGHYVTGVGRFDAGEQLLSGVVVVPPGGGAATVLVLDVDTGKILRETSVTHVGDVTAVSRRAFALEDGSVSIDGAPPVQLPIPSTHDRPRITDLLDVDGGVVAVGSADVVATSPLFARSRSLFARFATSPSTPEVLTIGTTVRSFIAVDPGGLAVLDEPEANGWVVGEPRPKRDIDVVRLDFDTGGRP